MKMKQNLLFILVAMVLSIRFEDDSKLMKHSIKNALAVVKKEVYRQNVTQSLENTTTRVTCGAPNQVCRVAYQAGCVTNAHPPFQLNRPDCTTRQTWYRNGPSASEHACNSNEYVAWKTPVSAQTCDGFSRCSVTSQCCTAPLTCEYTCNNLAGTPSTDSECHEVDGGGSNSCVWGDLCKCGWECETSTCLRMGWNARIDQATGEAMGWITSVCGVGQVHKPDAGTIACDHPQYDSSNECTSSMCCEHRSCANAYDVHTSDTNSYVCTSGRLKANPETFFCALASCSDDTCCEQLTCANIPMLDGTEWVIDSSNPQAYECTEDTVRMLNKPDADQIDCVGGAVQFGCEDAECCIPTCANAGVDTRGRTEGPIGLPHQCSNSGLKKNPQNIPCPDGCTDAICCEPQTTCAAIPYSYDDAYHHYPEGITDSDDPKPYDCAAIDKVPKASFDTIVCSTKYCTPDDCCDITCANPASSSTEIAVLEVSETRTAIWLNDWNSDARLVGVFPSPSTVNENGWTPVSISPYACTAGVLKSDYGQIACGSAPSASCSNAICCETPTCSSIANDADPQTIDASIPVQYSCGQYSVLKPDPDTLQCNLPECEHSDCCDARTCANDPTIATECSNDDQQVSVANVAHNVPCDSDPNGCTTDECCERTCATDGYTCPPGHKPKENLANTLCQITEENPQGACEVKDCCDWLTCDDWRQTDTCMIDQVLKDSADLPTITNAPLEPGGDIVVLTFRQCCRARTCHHPTQDAQQAYTCNVGIIHQSPHALLCATGPCNDATCCYDDR